MNALFYLLENFCILRVRDRSISKFTMNFNYNYKMSSVIDRFIKAPTDLSYQYHWHRFKKKNCSLKLL